MDIDGCSPPPAWTFRNDPTSASSTDKITATMFAEQEGSLTRQIDAIDDEAVGSLKEVNQRRMLAEQFEQGAVFRLAFW